MSFQRKLDCLWAVVIAEFMMMLMLFGWSMLGKNEDAVIAGLRTNIYDLSTNIIDLRKDFSQKIVDISISREDEIQKLKYSIMPSSLVHKSRN